MSRQRVGNAFAVRFAGSTTALLVRRHNGESATASQAGNKVGNVAVLPTHLPARFVVSIKMRLKLNKGSSHNQIAEVAVDALATAENSCAAVAAFKVLSHVGSFLSRIENEHIQREPKLGIRTLGQGSARAANRVTVTGSSALETSRSKTSPFTSNLSHFRQIQDCNGGATLFSRPDS